MEDGILNNANVNHCTSWECFTGWLELWLGDRVGIFTIPAQNTKKSESFLKYVTESGCGLELDLLEFRIWLT